MATSAEQPNAADARYTFDEEKLAALRSSCPWKDDPRYFKNVAISPSAVMKMVSKHKAIVDPCRVPMHPIRLMGFPSRNTYLAPRFVISSFANPRSASLKRPC